MRPLVLNYPHDQVTMQPERLRMMHIWRLATSARSLVSSRAHQHQIEVTRLASRLRRAVINGVAFTVAWEAQAAVLDAHEQPVLGSTEVDHATQTATVRLNAGLIGGMAWLARSTAVHELAHVVFDAPSWLAVHHGKPRSLSVMRSRPGRENEPDWAEWRANEFMGAFLAPRQLLHAELVKCAHELRLPLVEGHFADSLPVIALEGFSPWLDTLHTRLGALFGLSPSFIATRISKYRLVVGRQGLAA